MKLYEYFEQIERPIAFVLQDMESRGICVDLKYLEKLKTELEAQKQPLETEIKNELGNINLNSPKQLLEVLHAKEIYPKFKGKSSTDKRAFILLAETSIISLLLRFGELETLLSSFINPYLERKESVIHPWFNQCGTRTGRLSCNNPNLLQIPRKTENGKLVRKMFIPRAGMVMGDCDYGQIEPRLMAHLSKDAAMLQMFNDGVDFHQFTADKLGITREQAKVLNLSVGYRATKYSVQRQLGATLEEAQRQIDKWWGIFPTLKRWQDQTIYEAKRSSFCTTLMGRRIKAGDLSESNPYKREAAERQLINNIVQGSAAEVIKLAMIEIDAVKPMFTKFGLLVQIYDELLFESEDVKGDMEIVKECMENAVKLDVSLTVDVGYGYNWSECK